MKINVLKNEDHEARLYEGLKIGDASTGCIIVKWTKLRGRRINDLINFWCQVALEGLDI